MIVLKILLWIILGILLLALILIMLLLAAPITYRVDARYEKTADIKASVRFLIVSLKLEFNQEHKEFNQNISIAGFKLGRRKTDEFEEKASDALQDVVSDEKKAEDLSDSGPPIEDSGAEENDDKKGEDEQGEYGDTENVIDDKTYDDKNEEYDLWNNDNEEKAGLVARIKGVLSAVCNFIKKAFFFGVKLSPLNIADKIDDKLNLMNKKINRISKFWNLECTVKTRAYLKKYIVSVFRHIRPRRIRGYVHYGFDEPCRTGQVTGYLSLLPFVYQKGFSVTPDFYNKILEGHIYMRGHLRLGYLMRIVLNINIWRTVKVIKKLVNEA